MKISRQFLIVVFILSLLAGYTAGQFLFNHKNKIQHDVVNKTVAIQNSSGDQESLWLITIDRLDEPDPHIIGIWLLSYIPNYTKIKPLPLYPSENAQADTELAKVFHFSSDKKIASEFWDYLQDHNYTIHNYIVIDKFIAATILDMYGGVTTHGTTLSGLEVLAQLSNTQLSWDESIQKQVAVIDCICKSIFNSTIIPEMDKLQIETGKHIISNLDLTVKLKEWQSLIVTGDKKVCDFTDLMAKIQITLKP